MITQDVLKDWFIYEVETGNFIWKRSKGKAKKGSIAGKKTMEGYREIGINRKGYGAHRIAFLYMTGEMSKLQIDHINGIKDDNRWCNLREATTYQNHQNIKKLSNNTSGYKGVTFHKGSGKWQAQIQVNKIYKHLGSYETPELAFIAYDKYARENQGEFYREPQ